jgi:transposase InsO family protein
VNRVTHKSLLRSPAKVGLFARRVWADEWTRVPQISWTTFCRKYLSWLLVSSAVGSLNFLIFARLDRLPDLEQNQPAVLSTLGLRIRNGLTRLVVRSTRLLHESIRPLPEVVGLLRDLTRSRDQLIAENALLRQQLIVASQNVKRPAFKPHDRGLMVLLSRIVRGWRDTVLLVKPETNLRWHREGFRLFWKLKSRKRNPAESKISAEQIALIRQMAQENCLWGAERIRGELLKLGISVAKRTIQRYKRKVRAPTLPHGQSWKTFLANHTVWAGDFLQVHDIWFRSLFAFFVIDIKSREVIHVGVTRAPTEQWTAQQLRNITPFGEGPDVIIRHNDNKFGAEFDRVAKGAAMKVVRTAVKSPLMNAKCERFLGSVRRECLDHVIILGQRHLSNVLNEYSIRYFNNVRPHQGIRQRIPSPLASKKFTAGDTISSIPILAGFYHDYRVARVMSRIDEGATTTSLSCWLAYCADRMHG